MSMSWQPTESPVIDPASPSLGEQHEIHKDVVCVRTDNHLEEPVEAEEAWAAAEDTSRQYPKGFYVCTLIGRFRSRPSTLR